MIDVIRQKLSGISTREQKFNVAREFLQIVVLKILSDAQAFAHIAFIGGTALRILYGVKRYSEDLDFSLVENNGYDFQALTEIVSKEIDLQNVKVELKKKSGIIDHCMINFPSILQDLQISVARDQKLSVKLEIDTKPPNGAIITETVVNSNFMFPIRHYDLPSLMSGKLHAILFRKFLKGRDYYDLFWYLSRKTEPNLQQLENAIYQTEKKKLRLTGSSWQRMLEEKFSTVNFRKVQSDVQPFIENRQDIEMLTEKHFRAALASYLSYDSHGTKGR